MQSPNHPNQSAPERAENARPAPQPAEGAVSVWLYLAGLCVTFAGLYAVNFGVEDPNFSIMTYLLALGGYVTSYLMRVRGVSVRAIQFPLIAVLLMLIFAGLSNEEGLGWFAPASITQDRSKTLQLVFAWLAILHTYTLNADAAILFACVPCMTMIALVSTNTTETQVQNAFLLFICAATFLMVHENFLRTRTAAILGRNPGSERKLFRGQVFLAAFCFVGAIVLANFVAVPIQTVGQQVFVAGGLNPMNAATRSNQSKTSAVMVNERNAVELATGPVTERDTPLMKIQCDMGLYWRGTTFDYYTGHSFENRASVEGIPVDPSAPRPPSDNLEANYNNFSAAPMPRQIGIGQNRFVLPDGPLELPEAEMRNSVRRRQRVTIVGGIFTQIYGAERPVEIEAPFRRVQANYAGNLMTVDNLPLGTTYSVISRVPDTAPETLRAAKGTVPETIARLYLQAPQQEGPGGNARLRDLAAQITQGKPNDYEKAAAIQQYISTNCKYNLQATAAPREQDTVEHFLFDSHEGYCDSFGAAMTMLCRYAGIPARLASGFLAGDLDTNGDYIVREKHKHIWTEVFFPNIGWIPFDATEGAIDISDHSNQGDKRKTDFLAWLMSNGVVPPLIVLGILGALVYVLQTEFRARFRRRTAPVTHLLERPPTNVEITRLYLSVCKTLARRGYGRSPSETPDEYAQSIAAQGSNLLSGVSEPLMRLTALCTRFRYGPEVATAADVQAAREAAATLTQAASDIKKAPRATLRAVQG